MKQKFKFALANNLRLSFLTFFPLSLRFSHHTLDFYNLRNFIFEFITAHSPRRHCFQSTTFVYCLKEVYRWYRIAHRHYLCVYMLIVLYLSIFYLSIQSYISKQCFEFNLLFHFLFRWDVMSESKNYSWNCNRLNG